MFLRSKQTQKSKSFVAPESTFSNRVGHIRNVYSLLNYLSLNLIDDCIKRHLKLQCNYDNNIKEDYCVIVVHFLPMLSSGHYEGLK